jgi:NitT/TauT family transport system ATP-binding protein
VGRPKLLLMDEPFAALDEMTRAELNDDFLRLWKAAGLTVVFVTHSVAEAAYLSTRVAVMSPRPGRIVADIALSRAPAPDPARRFSQEFASDAKKISDALHGAMKAAA